MGQFDQLDAELADVGAVIDLVAPGDPVLSRLRAEVADLRALIEGGTPTAQDARQACQDLRVALEAVIERWKRELGRALVRGLPELPSVEQALGSADWLNGDGLTLPATLGPLALKVGFGQRSIAPTLSEGIPPISLPLPSLPVGLAAPDSLGAALSGPFPADGALRVHPDGIGGTLRLPLGPITVDALASLRRLPDGAPSFLAIIGASFNPSIQLSFGFAIDRVGGVVGIERRVDDQALGRDIRSGAASAALFAPSGADPLQRLAAAERLFPPAAGQYVIGPLFGLAWLSLGADLALVHVDLGVLVQLGGAVTVTVVGSARLILSELIRLQLDLQGTVDFARGRVSIDISVVEGRILGVFRLSGDAAFRSITSGEGAVVFSAGGFYPGFDPRPIEVGPLRRLSFGPDLPIPGFSLRVEGYLAATSNTFQVGGRLDATFDAVLITARGALGLDALVQFRPFHFNARVFGQFSVEALGRTFCGITIEGTIDGPGPISLAARLTIETFLKDIHWSETFTFGDGSADRVEGVGSLLDALASRALDPGSLKASAPDDHDVVLAPRRAAPAAPIERVVVAPLGDLMWSQRHTPLGILCDRFENTPLEPRGQGAVASVAAPALSLGEVKDPFAPGSHSDLPESQALHVPPFEQLISGLRIGFKPAPGTVADQPPDIRLLRLPLVGDGIVTAAGSSTLDGHELFHELADLGSRTPVVSVCPPELVAVLAVDDDWRTADGVAHSTLMVAWQHSRFQAGGLPQHATDPVITTGGV